MKTFSFVLIGITLLSLVSIPFASDDFDTEPEPVERVLSASEQRLENLESLCSHHHPRFDLVEDAIKARLNDPESYSRAGYWHEVNSDTTEAIMTVEYRARNGYGGLVLSETKVLVKPNGQISFVK